MSEADSPKHIQLIKKITLPLLIFFWGIAVAGLQVFPYGLIAEPLEDLQAWYLGSREGRQLSLKEKLADLLTDSELRVSGKNIISEKLNLSVKPVKDPLKLLSGSSRKLQYYSVHNKGYYIIFFIPRFSDADYAALVISARGEVKKLIKRPKIDYDIRTLGQGDISADGHLIFNSYFALYVTDLCGHIKLDLPKGDGKAFSLGEGVGFHHKGSSADGMLWTWYGNELRQYNLADSSLVKNITMEELIAANPQNAIFEARLIKSNLKRSVGQWKYQDLQNGLKLKHISLHDPFHQNDVDVLSQERAPLFPDFQAGDLLLSFRSINLITVIDPNTLKVKWWHYGDFSRQHDPDWALNGEITVYDNQSHQTASRIISINPTNHQVTELIKGEEWGFYQFAQGNHQLTDGKRVLYTNDSEMAHATNDRLDFYFKYTSRKGYALDIGNVYYLTDDQFKQWEDACK